MGLTQSLANLCLGCHLFGANSFSAVSGQVVPSVHPTAGWAVLLQVAALDMARSSSENR